MTTATSAVLLAAGFGTRMRPLTQNTPKALLRLGGRTLIDRALDRLSQAGITSVVVNAHWLAEKLEAHLAARTQPPQAVVRHEAELLDTAGAVLAALSDGMIGADQTPFFVVNSDSVWLDGPKPTLGRLCAALGDGLDAVILAHRTFQIMAEIGAGDFFLDPWGLPRRRREREIAPYIYAGVTLIRPAAFQGFADGALSMNAVWDRLIAAGRIRAVVHDGLWFHMTRPEDLRAAEQALAAQHTGQTT